MRRESAADSDRGDAPGETGRIVGLDDDAAERRGSVGDLQSLDGSWHFQEQGDGLTLATYTLEIGVNRRLGMLVRTVRGPVRARIESLLTDRPVEGLKARAEAAA